MKGAIFWKSLDLIGQSLMLLPLICLTSPEARGYALLTYFSLGGWQAGSCILNRILHMAPASTATARRDYEFFLTWTLGIVLSTAAACALCDSLGGPATGLTALLGSMGLLEGICLLLISPFTALWYARLTMDELIALRGAVKHRAEIHWKL